MSSDIKTIHALDRIKKAADMVWKHKIKKLPVIINNKIVGILKVTDLSKVLPDFSKKYDDSWEKPIWKD